MTRYVALLRGINVGGRSSVSMAALRSEMVGLGLDDVATYIQSGNVVFSSVAGEAHLVDTVESSLSSRFERPIRVVLRSAAELAAVASTHPFSASQDDPTKLSVTFLAAPPDADRQEVAIPAGETGELLLAGRDVYIHTPDGYGRSKLTNAFLERRFGGVATTRNWRSFLVLRDMTAG
ncbi:MAG: DUF1697 domain-containing protein [Pseudonocardia sp.]